MYIMIYTIDMKKIHSTTGKRKRIQNGEPFDWMLEKIAADKNVGILSEKINATDVSRHAILWYYRHLGYTELPKSALDMLKVRIEDIDL